MGNGEAKHVRTYLFWKKASRAFENLNNAYMLLTLVSENKH